MASKLLFPILLQLLGVVVIIVEFFVPTMGVLIAVSIGIFGYSLYVVFVHVSTGAGLVFLFADAVCVPVLVIVGFKAIARSPLALHSMLSSNQGVTSQGIELQGLVGKTGTTVSMLRPAGIALIDGKRLDVVSKGDFISAKTPVVVDTVTANQVIVRKIEDPAPTS